ncbi:MAG: response regulator transcription factor [Bacteroidales bacterium]|nr:response regulator transcription factor [Bacteroidales bacterium]
MNKEKRKILIIEDQNLFAQGLKGILESLPNTQIIGILNDSTELESVLKECKPNYLFLDLNLPNKNGFEILEDIRPLYSQLFVSILTMHEEESLLYKAKIVGANAFLSKDASVEELQYVLSLDVNSEFFIAQKIRDKMNDDKKQFISYNSIITNREFEILKHIAKGKSAQEISKALFISPRTVDTHRKNIMKKLDIHKISELIIYAIENNLD